MAQEEWSVQRLLRIIQVNLFERKLLRLLFVPDKKWRKQEEPQLRFFLGYLWDSSGSHAPFFINIEIMSSSCQLLFCCKLL
jgi:hypothetical protein